MKIILKFSSQNILWNFPLLKTEQPGLIRNKPAQAGVR